MATEIKNKGVANEVLEQKIYKELTLGTPASIIRERIRTDYWKLGISFGNTTSVQNIITRVRKRVVADWKEEAEELRETMLTRLTDLYKECREQNDRLTALNTLKYLGKLGGLEEPQKIDLNVTGEVEIDFNMSE